MIGLGENLFNSEEQLVSNFLIASFNMLPIVLSGFVMIHALKMMKAGEVYIVIMLLFIYMFSRSEEHTSELQSRGHLVCRLLLEKKNVNTINVGTQCVIYTI